MIRPARYLALVLGATIVASCAAPEPSSRVADSQPQITGPSPGTAAPKPSPTYSPSRGEQWYAVPKVGVNFLAHTDATYKLGAVALLHMKGDVRKSGIPAPTLVRLTLSFGVKAGESLGSLLVEGDGKARSAQLDPKGGASTAVGVFTDAEPDAKAFGLSQWASANWSAGIGFALPYFVGLLDTFALVKPVLGQSVILEWETNFPEVWGIRVRDGGPLDDQRLVVRQKVNDIFVASDPHRVSRTSLVIEHGDDSILTLSEVTPGLLLDKRDAPTAGGEVLISSSSMELTRSTDGAKFTLAVYVYFTSQGASSKLIDLSSNVTTAPSAHFRQMSAPTLGDESQDLFDDRTGAGIATSVVLARVGNVLVTGLGVARGSVDTKDVRELVGRQVTKLATLRKTFTPAKPN